MEYRVWQVSSVSRGMSISAEYVSLAYVINLLKRMGMRITAEKL